jgi:hypothetical protein
MGRNSVYYKGESVHAFTMANIFKKTIAARLTAGAQLNQLANALHRAIYDDDVDMLLKMAHKPPMLKNMESFFISYCPDQPSERKTLNEWFKQHSKNNIAPIYLLW